MVVSRKKIGITRKIFALFMRWCSFTPFLISYREFGPLSYIWFNNFNFKILFDFII